jgi:hypothetical protein
LYGAEFSSHRVRSLSRPTDERSQLKFTAFYKGKGKGKEKTEAKEKHGREAGKLPYGIQHRTEKKGELPSGLQKKKEEEGQLTRGLEKGGKNLTSPSKGKKGSNK